MTNQNYNLDDLENAAINKTNTAKRVAASVGLMAAGAGTAFAASALVGDDEPEIQPEVKIDESEIDNVAQTGANEVHGSTEEATHEHSTVVNHNYYVNVEDPQQEETGANVQYTSSSHYYDEDGNLIGTAEEGTINGHHFTVVDTDNDGGGDFVAIDSNGNGVYEDNEKVYLDGNEQIAMGHDTMTHHDYIVENVIDEPVDIIGGGEDIVTIDGDDDDIVNDFEDDRTGEDYSNDYAENNENYNNNGDVDRAYADYHHDNDFDGDANDMAMNDDYTDHYTDSVDDDYTGDYAMNDASDDNYADDYSEDYAMEDTVDDSYDNSLAMDDTVDDSYDDSLAMDDTTIDDSFDIAPDDSYDVI